MVKAQSRAADVQAMNHFAMAIARINPWMDLEAAADYSGLPHAELLAAATKGLLPATVTHARRPGDWMVRMDDIELYAAQRPTLWPSGGAA